MPTRGSDDFYYSAHKAELEGVLDEIVGCSKTDAYVFRPCIVAGAGAPMLIETMVGMLPVYGQLRLARRVLDTLPFLGPVLPDPGVDFQLVHTDDVATALLAAVEGDGEPGRYNLAGPGSMSVTRLTPPARLVVGADPGRRGRRARRRALQASRACRPRRPG